MFSKSVVAVATVLLGFSLQAHAHAGVTPALGVTGTFARSNVQRPSQAKPCGTIDIAQNIDSSTAITAAANGTFAATITNFNAGVDGSRQVTAQIDPTGTGNSFTAATVLQNGDKNPTSTGSQQLVVEMPAGTTCSGGATGDKCLVSFVTAGGFGNCAVVQSTAAAGGNATAGTAGTAGTGTAAGTGTTSTAAAGTKKGKGKKAKAAAAHAKAKQAAAAQAQAAQAQAAQAGQVQAAKLQNKVKQARDINAVGSRAARALRRAEEAADDLA